MQAVLHREILSRSSAPTTSARLWNHDDRRSYYLYTVVYTRIRSLCLCGQRTFSTRRSCTRYWVFPTSPNTVQKKTWPARTFPKFRCSEEQGTKMFLNVTWAGVYADLEQAALLSYSKLSGLKPPCCAKTSSAYKIPLNMCLFFANATAVSWSYTSYSTTTYLRLRKTKTIM